MITGLPIHVDQYLSSESSRQSASVEPMVEAYKVAKAYKRFFSESFLLDLSTCFGYSWYRTVPVTFASGGHASNHSTLPDAVPRLINHAPVDHNFQNWYEWVKAFLQYHPFEDGNGRVASLVFNWGMGTLDEPLPLPYYSF